MTSRGVLLRAWTGAAALLLAGAGCAPGPRPVRVGRDECAECRMTIVDPRYAAEHVTARGRVHVFDDVVCLLAHLRRVDPAGAGHPYVADFARPGVLLDARKAEFLRHPGFRSPMAGGMAAFAGAADLASVRRELGEGGGETLPWARVLQLPP